MLVTRSEKKLSTWSWLLHVIGLAITCTGFVALYAFVLSPIHRRHAEVVEQAARLERILDQEVSVTEEHRQLTQLLATADEKILRLLDQIPNVPRESDFLGQITTLAREVGLEIVDYRPGRIVQQDEYREMSVALSSVGSYAGICNFLHRIHQIPRLSRAVQLRIAPEHNGATYSMEMTLKIYFAPQTKLAVVSEGNSNG